MSIGIKGIYILFCFYNMALKIKRLMIKRLRFFHHELKCHPDDNFLTQYCTINISMNSFVD